MRFQPRHGWANWSASPPILSVNSELLFISTTFFSFATNFFIPFEFFYIMTMKFDLILEDEFDAL